MILMMIHEPWIQGWIRAHSSFEESAQLWLLDHFTVLQDSDWTKVPSFGWSCLKNPKWRIREAQVSFLSVGDVLCWHLKLGITLLSKKYHINVRKLAQRLAQLATNFQGLEICPSPVFNEINSKSQVTKCLLCRLLHRNHNILRSCTIWKSGTATRKGISLHWHWILIGYWSGIDWFLWCVCQIQLVSMTRAMFTCNNTSIREGIRRFVGTRLTVTDPGGGIDSLLSLGCTTFWWVDLSSLGCVTFWWRVCTVKNLCLALTVLGAQGKGLEQQNSGLKGGTISFWQENPQRSVDFLPSWRQWNMFTQVEPPLFHKEWTATENTFAPPPGSQKALWKSIKSFIHCLPDFICSWAQARYLVSPHQKCLSTHPHKFLPSPCERQKLCYRLSLV